MPYVNQRRRAQLYNVDLFLDDLTELSEGDLTYIIYKICMNSLPNKDKVRYKDFHKIIGVLESAKMEFYRRQVVPYEDTKIEENGDVV